MIQQLLSKYRSRIGLHNKSSSYGMNEAHDLVTYRYYGDVVMRFLLFAWLIFQTYTYYEVSKRPLSLFQPINWFDKVLMPVLPNHFLWWGVILLLMFAVIRLFLKPESSWEKYVLALGVMWVNCIRWKFEFFSHVGHLMVLYYLLSMFLPSKKSVSRLDLMDYAKAIRWLFCGLLVGYTMSGVWKVVGFVYKTVFKPTEITWFHPDAMLLNSSVGFRDWDEQMGWLGDFFEIRWIWQILFVVMLLLQLGSVLGAVRIKLLPYIALGNILFHVANVLFVRIEFYVAPLVLLAVFFPYHLVFNKEKEEYSNKYGNGKLTRVYENGDRDEFSGFYAFREYKYDQNPLVWGILFVPGVSLLARPFFKLVRN